MRILEEGYLKKSVEKFNIDINELGDFKTFFLNSDNIDIKSLQKESFKNEIKFFEEVSFVFSVIASIIARPHLLNKRDEIVIRAEQAARIDPEAFNKTVKDPKPWKQKGAEKVPEYVYYYEQNDLLRIYENIFVVMLIDILSKEIDSYYLFYTSLIKTFEEGSNLSLRSDYSLKGLDYVTKLKKRARFIKSTRFYKEIKRGGVNLKEVHASNILINDRLYNYCYKFYRKIISYKDIHEKLRDIRTYYFIYLARAFKEQGFRYVSEDTFTINRNSHLIAKDLELENDDLNILVNFVDYNGISFQITNKYVPLRVAKQNHLLLFNADFDFANVDYDPNSRYKTIESLSLWNLFYFDKFRVANKNYAYEEDLARRYLKEKIQVVLADRKYYQRLCPSCKEEFTDNIKPSYITCPNCDSTYSLYRKNGVNRLWFIKLRKND